MWRWLGKTVSPPQTVPLPVKDDLEDSQDNLPDSENYSSCSNTHDSDDEASKDADCSEEDHAREVLEDMP